VKVKDLIEKLQALDPEKEIKTIEASGWECELETKTDIEIVDYESFKFNNSNHYSVDNDGKDKDFYVLK
jgi:predicted KAP-like P-loop ATPase